MTRNGNKRINLTSTQILMLGFVALILGGALLLMLPCCTAAGEKTDFLTALFTATTSVSVTGLVVVDTFSHWSLIGQIVILCLIQMGGFGIITLYSLVIWGIGKKFSIKERTLIQDYYDLDSPSGIVKFLLRVVKCTFIVEGCGMVGYAFAFVPEFGIVKGLWVSFFTAISAFCNAGIDIIGNNSLCNYTTNGLVNFVTAALIILGGLGFIVWFDVLDKLKDMKAKQIKITKLWSRLGEHSKLVAVLTLLLILSGTVLVAVFEWDNPDTIGDMSVGNKIMVSMFQSITFRTAGFASVPQENLTPLTAIAGLFYMFIGGSPVGTAGGVKTVTIFMIALNVVSFIRQRDEAVVFSRKVTSDLINKATAVVTVSFTITVICFMALIATNDVSILSAAYEITSATATVGLSRGLTASLNNAGRIIVICAMYMGRIGPISMALFFSTGKPNKNDISYAKGHYKVG